MRHDPVIDFFCRVRQNNVQFLFVSGVDELLPVTGRAPAKPGPPDGINLDSAYIQLSFYQPLPNKHVPTEPVTRRRCALARPNRCLPGCSCY